MSAADARGELAKQIAGEIVVSDDPGGTIRKWRRDFDITQIDLADEVGVSSSVISDYEGGRRPSPGIDVIRRLVEGMLELDERRGGNRIRQFARVLSAGFDSDVVLDLREYEAAVSIDRFNDTIGAKEVQAGSWDRITGHTVIDSIRAITSLSHEEFFRLYGQSTSRALVFTEISRGQSPLVALRVVTPTPNLVVLHGIDRGELWDHAPALARMDGYALSTSSLPIEDVLDRLRELP